MAEYFKRVSPIMEEAEGIYYIKCPGCKNLHPLNTNPNNGQPVWVFNGDVNKPTFTPSLLCNASFPESRCHSFIANGQIQFLSDCHHELAGLTVDLPELGDI